MNDKLVIGLLAATLIMTGVNTYLISSQEGPTPNLKPEDGQTKQSTPASGVNNEMNNQSKTISTTTNPNDNTPGTSINNMSGDVAKTSVTFEKMVHEFGNVVSTSENKYNFKFTNSGDAPLIISSARGSCGCTVPSYPEGPIAPGESGVIEVIYKPKGQSGPQTKTVTITANTDPANTLLTIKANVSEG